MAGPERTPEDHGWGCTACPWRGRSLAGAKGHLLGTPAVPAQHLPFEAPLAGLEDAKRSGMKAKGATRVMHPHPDDPALVSVLSYDTAVRRFQAMARPLVASAAGRRR